MSTQEESVLSRRSPRTAPVVCNILVVDDEPSNVLAIEAILEPLGQNVVRASSGRAALLLALRHDFALVLLDVQMPGMDGFETARLLRSRPRTRDVPIIFVTAISKEPTFITRGYDVGAVDYLFKPYEPDMLRSKVSVFVELARKSAIIQAQHEALRVMSERELADFKRLADQRYADLADAMPQVVWTADSHGRIAYRNARWTDLGGSAARDFADIVHPDDLERMVDGWRWAVAEGRSWSGEIRFGSAAKGYCHHLVRATPRRDDGGALASWIGTATDIDDRVRAERALRLLADASRRLGGALGEPADLGYVLESALPLLGDAAILDLRPESAGGPLAGEGTGRRVSAVANGVAPRLLDDPRFELGPTTVAYSGRPEIHLDVSAELAEGQLGRRSENLRFLAELGVRSYVCVPLISRERVIGSLAFARLAGRHACAKLLEEDLGVIEDLARRVAASIDNTVLHETTEKRREELEVASRSKDVFLATLSHELRTPLNAIVGWTDIMRTDELDGADLARAVDTIDRNAHALSGLVADLLDVSRIVTGTLNLDSTLVSIAAVIEAAALAAEPQCAAKRLVLRVDARRVGCVRGDAGRLKQVLGNLLSNAIKFTPAGGEVNVRLERHDGVALVVVEDTGDGIPAELLPHVFERFRQAEKARARGLGLGLAIVKHLVEEQGGTVRAQSEGQGKGARFEVELPIAEEEAAAEDAGACASHQAPGGGELAGVHVLVVEDDPDGNELVTTILQRFGARVTSVATAAAALSALEIEMPDLLLSDIGLPDADGMTLVREVRARPLTAYLPAVALTAYASRQDATKAVAAGFDAHVAKPVQPHALGDVLANVLSRSKAAPVRPQPAA
jgi:signal transduction histidine kinase/DNA-binding response OmpR family regulator